MTTKATVAAAVAAVAIIAGLAITQDDGTTTGTATFTGLPLGQHTIEVAAIDAAGNMDPTPAAVTFEVVAENTAPTAAVTWHADTATLAANIDGDIREVLWFINGTMVGRQLGPPWQRRTARTGLLVFKASVREHDGDLATSAVTVTR